MTAGFAMRTAISGRAPVTNMYESLLLVAWALSLFAVFGEPWYRERAITAAAAATATVALFVADMCPAAVDPGLRLLPLDLRTNVWLVAHVLTATLSYAAFALALGLGNLTLAHYWRGTAPRPSIEALTAWTCRALRAGVVLFATGTVLGAVWADQAWGRFWGWEPKEAWALITLLGYLAVLHAFAVGQIRSFGLAALAVLGFALVLMTWYGVNFVLGAGRHSYGFGRGGEGYVLVAAGLQAAYVVAAVIVQSRRAREEAAPMRRAFPVVAARLR